VRKRYYNINWYRHEFPHASKNKAINYLLSLASISSMISQATCASFELIPKAAVVFNASSMRAEVSTLVAARAVDDRRATPKLGMTKPLEVAAKRKANERMVFMLAVIVFTPLVLEEREKSADGRNSSSMRSFNNETKNNDPLCTEEGGCDGGGRCV
jgi:hypothetical protein